MASADSSGGSGSGGSGSGDDALDPDRIDRTLAEFDAELAGLAPELAALGPDTGKLDPDLANLDPGLANLDPDLANLDPDLETRAEPAAGISTLVDNLVAGYNAAVPTGNFVSLLAAMHDDVVCTFDGLASPPLHGKAAVVESIERHPPRSTIAVTRVSCDADGQRFTCAFEWLSVPAAGGIFILGTRDGLIVRLDCHFEGPVPSA